MEPSFVRAQKKFLLGEQPTKRSLDDKKRYALSKEILEIDHKGVTLKEPTLIVKAFHNYYWNIFGKVIPTGSHTDVQNLLSNMPFLNDDSKKIAEGPITLDEVKAAIDSLKTGKTPGPDGLGSEFYKKFKEQLSPVLLKSFHESYNCKMLPPSFYDCHTVLIPKTKDNELLKKVENYRPISLCNVDYKVFANIINERRQMVIEDLVGEHQTCGIRGRSIQTNIHVARSVLEYMHQIVMDRLR